MDYKKIFDPVATLPQALTATVERRADRRDGRVYVYSDEIILAVNVALQLGLRYYEEVIASHTQAKELLWHFDALRRLNDAQANRLQEGMEPYMTPGVLWWAFNPESAQKIAQSLAPTQPLAPDAPGLVQELSAAEKAMLPEAVVLLDEIDKADPDVPNNLLVPLGSLQFNVPDLQLSIKTQRPPLLIITTNDERELPNAFLRRCVILQLPDPDKDKTYRPLYKKRLRQIAERHFGVDDMLYDAVVDLMMSDNDEPEASRSQATSSPAEYLDAIRTCRELNVRPGNQNWEQMSAQIARIVLRKARSG